MSKKILITGANRGLGFAFVKVSLDNGYTVLAGCRNPEKAEDLKQLRSEFTERLHIINLDPTNINSIKQVVEYAKQHFGSLDILVNNAGMNSKSSGVDPSIHLQLGKFQAEPILNMFHLNAVAPLIMAQEFLDLLSKSQRGLIVNISSWFASLSIPQKGNYSYSASKAALNMFNKVLANDLGKYGILTLAVNPGWMKTDMGGKSASLEPEESAKSILEFSQKLKMEDSGKFFNHDGSIHLW
ncbi:MAG TPA: SDR family oxidoreductase [Leptospiraceae bacterium]|nr:SDR family oxidoreductase [Leptospiraceae bacterium]HMW07712.1 SDR family oxidoreductase [Leptospiraceae bacterium]HMX32018.1 SDR family oxidoreductase [Leptospiraceae bacterium]HMY33378.1 SDR family oxidoreductase [Leptospiraceae bacterium]HMZ67139.1 SDR family oxidoreductase [Leptospiraceae bacterium]